MSDKAALEILILKLKKGLSTGYEVAEGDNLEEHFDDLVQRALPYLLDHLDYLNSIEPVDGELFICGDTKKPCGRRDCRQNNRCEVVVERLRSFHSRHEPKA